MTVFGLLSLACLNCFGHTLAGNEFEITLLPFLYALAAVIYIPVCLRWAGYRVIRRRQAVIVQTDQTEQVTADQGAALLSSSLPMLVVAVAWIVTANLSGAITRHAFYWGGERCYGSLDSKYREGNLYDASVPLVDAERVLRSPLFRSLQTLTVSDDGEINDALVEAALLHDQLTELRIPNAAISESLFLRLAHGKAWDSLTVRYPPRLAQSDEAASDTSRTGSIQTLVFVAETAEERDALTVAAVEQFLKTFRIGSIRLWVSDYVQQTSNYDFAELASLSHNHPDLDIWAKLGSQQGSVGIDGDLVLLDHLKLFTPTSVEAISLLKPHILIASNCDTDLADLPDDQRGLLKQLNIATREIQTLELHSASLDAEMLDHFATADSLELAWVFLGQLDPQDARLIAARPNITTLVLNCHGIPMESVAALREAKNVKTVYYPDDWQPTLIAAVRSEWKEVEWLPLSAR